MKDNRLSRSEWIALGLWALVAVPCVGLMVAGCVPMASPSGDTYVSEESVAVGLTGVSGRVERSPVPPKDRVAAIREHRELVEEKFEFDVAGVEDLMKELEVYVSRTNPVSGAGPLVNKEICTFIVQGGKQREAGFYFEDYCIPPSRPEAPPPSIADGPAGVSPLENENINLNQEVAELRDALENALRREGQMRIERDDWKRRHARLKDGLADCEFPGRTGKGAWRLDVNGNYKITCEPTVVVEGMMVEVAGDDG